MIGSRRRGNIGLNSKDNAGEVVHAVPGEKLRPLVTNDYPNLFPHQLFSMSAPPHTKPLWTWPVATREGAKGETGTAGHTPCDGKEETEWRRSKGGAFKSVAKYFPERRLGTRVKSKASAKSRRRPRAGRCRTAPPRTQALMPGACVGSGAAANCAVSLYSTTTATCRVSGGCCRCNRTARSRMRSLSRDHTACPDGARIPSRCPGKSGGCHSLQVLG
jgi:hypothetical protein